MYLNHVTTYLAKQVITNREQAAFQSGLHDWEHQTSPLTVHEPPICLDEDLSFALESSAHMHALKQ